MRPLDLAYNLAGLAIMLLGIWLWLSVDWPEEPAPEPDAEEDEYDGDDQFIVRWNKDGNQAEWGRDVWP